MNFPASVPPEFVAEVQALIDQTWPPPVYVGNIEELRAAIFSADTTPKLIELTNDIFVDDRLPLFPPDNSIIKIDGAGHKIDASAGRLSYLYYNNGIINIRHGALYLRDVEITSMHNEESNSGIRSLNGNIVLESGSVISKNYANYGGGILFQDGASFVDNHPILLMRSGSVVSDNIASIHGGGINSTSHFVMEHGAKIINNTAAIDDWGFGGGLLLGGFTMLDGYPVPPETQCIISGTIANNKNGSGSFHHIRRGGGIFADSAISDVHLVISGADIRHNESARNGGGILLQNHVRCEIINSNIVDNFAQEDGGGIAVYNNIGTKLDISGNTKLTGNEANKNGGAISIPYSLIEDLDVGPDVVFSYNKAAEAYDINWAVDGDKYNDHIHATQFTAPFDNAYNNLDISYTTGTQTFVPIYTDVTAHMTTTGAPIPDGRFEFGLYDESDNLISEAANDENGDIVFTGVTLGSPDAHTFTVRQVTQSDNEWTADDAIYRVNINAYDRGDMVLEAYDPTYPDGSPVFNNVYRGSSGGGQGSAEATVSARLKLCGYAPPPTSFSFGLYDEAGQLVAEASMSGAGDIVFDPVEFDTPGRYQLSIRQTSAAIPDWTLDSRIRTATVIVMEKGGVLQARMRPDILVFVYKYGSCLR